MKFIASEFKKTILVTKWVFGLYFKNFPILISIYGISEILLNLSGIINAYVIGLVVDKAIKVANGGNFELSIFYPSIALIVIVYVLFQFIDIIGNFAWLLMENRDWYVIRTSLIDKLARLGISNLENPELTNKIQRFDEERGKIRSYVSTCISILSGIITFTVSGWFIIKNIPYVALLTFIVLLIKFASNQKFIRILWLFNRDTTEERRKVGEAFNDLSHPNPLKELILSGGRIFLINKTKKYMDLVANKYDELRVSWTKYKFINSILESMSFAYGIAMILKRLLAGLIGVGQLTFEIRSLRIFSDTFGAFMNNIVGLREYVIRLYDIYEIFTNFEEDFGGTKKVGPLDINFSNVSFKYPNSNTNVFKNLNLRINRGEKVAIVGENGAGKTTLVKLMCRFYRVNSGEIKLGKLNINNIDIKSWYKKISILFQNYNTYPYLTAKENILISSNPKEVSNTSIIDAAKKSDSYKFISKYDFKFDKILSERYKGGIRPSTGQWQKIAIARVFHRNAPVLILDEPTASIDAVAEAKIFDNIYKFAKDKTVIIISHRFSTVRNADRIIVLDKGKIIEQGSHEELLQNNGKYAKAFKLQAKGYQ